METKEFTGGVSAMKESPWLASEDLLGRGAVSVTIDRVFLNTGVKFEGGREEKKPIYSVSFVGLKKQLILNGTNRKTLSTAFGSTVRSWSGKTCKIFVKDGIRKPGTKNETCCGLRIIADANPDLVGENPVAPPTPPPATEPASNALKDGQTEGGQ